MRGNVGTRLRKLADGEVDALVLAMAGLSRLGLLDAAVTPLDPSLLMPAPAQGVLAVECRTDDPVTAAQLRTLDHAPTRAAAITERGFLAALDAGCSAPVGALAELTAQTGAEPAVRLSGLIAAPDGSSVIRAQMTGPVGDGEALGRRLAHALLEHGGAALLDRTSPGSASVHASLPERRLGRRQATAPSRPMRAGRTRMSRRPPADSRCTLWRAHGGPRSRAAARSPVRGFPLEAKPSCSRHHDAPAADGRGYRLRSRAGDPAPVRTPEAVRRLRVPPATRSPLRRGCGRLVRQACPVPLSFAGGR